MALNQPALLEFLEALQATASTERARAATEHLDQALIAASWPRCWARRTSGRQCDRAAQPQPTPDAVHERGTKSCGFPTCGQGRICCDSRSSPITPASHGMPASADET